MTMNCREFERRLDESLDRETLEALMESARDHLARCAECRDLSELARASFASGPTGGDLVEAVMKRTTGSACLAARRLLATGDADLEMLDRRLLDRHLQRCRSCLELGETLVWLDGVLPDLVEVRPDPGFLRDVLRATSGRPRPRGWLETRLGAWLGDWIQRPRFALEAAYVGAMILWLVFGTPVSPLRGLSTWALEAVRTGSTEVLGASISPVADALAMPASASRRPWDVAGKLLEREDVEAPGRWSRFTDHARSLGLHGLKAMRGAFVGRLEESRENLDMMRIDLESIWNELTRQEERRDARTPTNHQSQEA